MDFKRFVPISKVDEEKRMVYGWASTPDLDSQGEKVSVGSLKKALPEYMKFPAVRQMHQPKAAGTTKEARTSDKGLFIGAKIVADDAWNLVKEKVYRGFSIGGKVKQMADNVITALDLTEISLVDVPANRNTVFTLVKKEGGKLIDKQTNEEIPQWVRQQNEMISKLTIGSLRKEVIEEMAKPKKKEELEEVTEETPQAPEETPEEEEEEKEEETKEETEVSEESPEVAETVIDETVQASANPDDVTKRLEKLEKTLTEEPKFTDEEVAMAKVTARFDTQIAKVESILGLLTERLAKVESMAAPVKARPSYLVEKGEVTEDSEIEKKRARARELDSIRKSDTARYQREGMQEEALALFDELKEL